MSPKAKWTVTALAAVLLLAALPPVGLALLGPDWLKGKLVETAREKLDADLKIDSLTFSPFDGRAELKGIRFDRKTDSSEVHATAESVRMNVRVWPLVYRSIDIDLLEAVRPSIAWTVQEPPDAERVSTYDKLKKVFSARKSRSDRKVELLVRELHLRDATVDFVSLKEGREPFKARATEIQYSATSVSLDSFGRLASGADLSATIDLGGMPAQLRKRSSDKPSTVSLRNINLAYVDRYFEQSDALVMTGGTLNLSSTDGDDVNRLQAEFQGLELGENPAAAKQEFAFVPIGRIRDLVKSRGGNVNLAFAWESGPEASDDVRVLIDEVSTGMWKALIKSMTTGAIKDVFEKGKQKVLEHLKPDEKK